MDQLTGGIVDVAVEEHKDGTTKYQTSELATHIYGDGFIQGRERFTPSPFQGILPIQGGGIKQEELPIDAHVRYEMGIKQGTPPWDRPEQEVKIMQEQLEPTHDEQSPRIKQEPGTDLGPEYDRVQSGTNRVGPAAKNSRGAMWTADVEVRVKPERFEATRHKAVQTLGRQREATESDNERQQLPTAGGPQLKRRAQEESCDGRRIKREPDFDNIVW